MASLGTKELTSKHYPVPFTYNFVSQVWSAPVSNSIVLNSAGRKSAREVQQIYLRVKGEVFGSGKGLLAKGNSDKLQEELQEWLGKDTKMSAVTYPR